MLKLKILERKSWMVIRLNNFRDITKLTNSLKFFLYASLVVNFIALLFDYLEYSALISAHSSTYASAKSLDQVIELNNSRQAFVGSLQMATALLTSVLFLRWIYFSNANAHALKANGMQFTPLWSILWYFVPIAHLWKPYQAMNEIWKCSENPHQWTLIKTDSILHWWWFLWILSLLADQLLIRYALDAHDIQGSIHFAIASSISDFMHIPPIVVAILLITRISSMQMSQHARQTGGYTMISL
jgi:hypothetical protein